MTAAPKLETCSRCGDGVEPGHELCGGCEAEQKRAAQPRYLEDNWRRSVRVPRSRRR